ncbi:MAG: GTPase Era [Saprospiraceae bacterium]|nr:GTPase Era [Saprospiraceae bacterium]
MSSVHRSGFVNILGHPNVGKSTLMNALVGERMSIVSAKPQTTRHRILGILSGDDFQLVFSDTPGFVLRPAYRMHEKMNAFVAGAFEDADLVLLVTEAGDAYAEDDLLLQHMQDSEAPRFLVVNKSDRTDPSVLEQTVKDWENRLSFDRVFVLSALQQTGTDELAAAIRDAMPEGPAWYPKDQLTDRPERFFVAELIREQIFHLYEQEIPYSVEVVVEYFQEPAEGEKDLIRIGAEIYVMRNTQKAILLGKGGQAIKKLGIQARAAIEEFLGQQIYLELHVKIRPKWRDDDRSLRSFGYVG